MSYIPSATGRRGSSPSPTGTYANREETIERLWTFLSGLNTSGFTMSQGATDGDVLISDANGAASWGSPNTLSLGARGYPAFGYDPFGQSDAFVITKPAVSGVMAVRAASVSHVAQTGSIDTTTFFSPTSAGVYLISTYLVCTTAEAGTGTVSVSLGWIDETGGLNERFTAVASCALTSLAFASDVRTIYVDSGTSVMYRTTYTPTAGGTTEAYSVYLRAVAL